MSGIDTTPMEDPAKAAAERLRLKLLTRRAFRVEHEGDQFDVRAMAVGIAAIFNANIVSLCTYVAGSEDRLFPTDQAADGVGVESAPLLRKLRNAALAHLVTAEDLAEIAARLPTKE